MGALSVQRDVEMHQDVCKACDVVFLYPRSLHDARYEHGGYIYCPNGHGWGWKEGRKEREEKDLRKQLEAERTRTQAALERANEAGRLAEELNKKLVQAGKKFDNHKKRVAAGTCPCCQRTFKQLAAHMKNKHPEYSA